MFLGMFYIEWPVWKLESMNVAPQTVALATFSFLQLSVRITSNQEPIIKVQKLYKYLLIFLTLTWVLPSRHHQPHNITKATVAGEQVPGSKCLGSNCLGSNFHVTSTLMTVLPKVKKLQTRIKSFDNKTSAAILK